MRNMTPETLEMIAKKFRVLGDPLRLRLLHALQSGELSVGALCNAVGAKQPNASKQLSLLMDSGWVGKRKSGNSVFYKLDDMSIVKICEIVCGSLQDCLQQKLGMISGADQGKKN